jgi:hypothetical protein
MTVRTHDECLSKKEENTNISMKPPISILSTRNGESNGEAEKNFQREPKILFRKSASTGNPANRKSACLPSVIPAKAGIQFVSSGAEHRQITFHPSLQERGG